MIYQAHEMISRLFPTKQLLWTSEKASNMSGNFAFERSLKYKDLMISFLGELFDRSERNITRPVFVMLM